MDSSTHHSLSLQKYIYFNSHRWTGLDNYVLRLPFAWKGKLLSGVQLFATPRTMQSMEFSRPEYWSGEPFHSQGHLPNPGIQPRSPELQADSLPAEPQGKPQNTGVGSLFVLQWIFLTQESNQGPLHCRQILCQLSYQGCLEFSNSIILRQVLFLVGVQ